MKQSQGKGTQIESSLKKFSRFIISQEKHNISVREVLNYELSALPLNIAYLDGVMVKSNKASLGRELKKIVPIKTELPLDRILIFYGMVLLQKVPKHCSTFSEISDFNENNINNEFFVSLIFKSSLKALERKERSISGTMRYEVKRGEQKRPNQHKILEIKCLYLFICLKSLKF